VSYNGNGPANTATLGGQVQALFGSMHAVLSQAKGGRLRPLAVGTPSSINLVRPRMPPHSLEASPCDI
jgi:tripartite-type tricarboxylate transporter receptor subunit TctC